MTTTPDTSAVDLDDRQIARLAVGSLAAFNRAGVLAAADVHVAQRLGAVLGEGSEDVLLAVALTVRAVRQGSVCLDLAAVSDAPLEADPELVAALGWPEPVQWVAAVAASPVVAAQALRLEGTRLYLDRYWREEVQVRDALAERLDHAAVRVDEELLAAALDRVFASAPGTDYSEQRAVADAAVRRRTTVITGGPGTGKTTTVARLLALVAEQHRHETGREPRIALCAPTAKAAARLQESVAEQTAQLPAQDRARLGGLSAMTLHRLLGWRPGSSTRFRHDHTNHLPHDVVVVDETSMVSLTLMARLLEAMRGSARLVLVGDADQLASVEAGAVLADVVRGLEGHPLRPVARLTRVHRFGTEIGSLADAIRLGDADAALAVLRAGHDAVRLLDPADDTTMAVFDDQVTTAAAAVWAAAEAGDAASALAAMDSHRLLCAHRDGPAGVRGWNRRIERLLADRTGIAHYDAWYAGRPILVSTNDYTVKVYNGDIGVTLRGPRGRLEVALAGLGSEGPRVHAVTRLPEVETVYAMTVHKAQGSQARVVSVVMPPEGSTLLTRELFYTAVTRAIDRVQVVGTEAAVRAAISRQVQRASGLAERLQTS